MSFRWLPYEGKRHAVHRGLQPGDDGETLCGTAVSPVPERTPVSEWPASWHECPGCDGEWRQREEIPLRCNRIAACAL
ncbi:zinc finger protein [Saccharothrix syringae]|uniref:Zinc-finger domain-containing protein n=1 Tax=Saccharothrix syringae TaxID=103733 RepID=A0A5Q0H3Q1_SACSY|nr:zinc finger protein [Saccharothrix syringae]QFZ20440.1 hypothetical protein EKG83_26170 [Saccharothrix syringae]